MDDLESNLYARVRLWFWKCLDARARINALVKLGVVASEAQSLPQSIERRCLDTIVARGQLLDLLDLIVNRSNLDESLCLTMSPSGRNGEPLACALPKGHAENHAWWNLPTFADGLTVTEKAADKLLNNYGEFGDITDSTYLDELDRALKCDVPEIKARDEALMAEAIKQVLG